MCLRLSVLFVLCPINRFTFPNVALTYLSLNLFGRRCYNIHVLKNYWGIYMKKFLSLILCGAMVLSLASCNASNTEETVTSTTPASDTTVSSEPGADFAPDFTFKTTDRSGNGYDESVFASAKLTMINFWEPWCGPCVNEMPDLERLYEAYKDKGFQIIGVYSETGMENDVDDILNNGKVSYPILKYTSEFDIFQTGYVPTTVFVDQNGHIIKMENGAETVIGSNTYDEWEAIIKNYL